MKQLLKLGHSNIEIEAETPKALFDKAAQMTEVFGEKCCGCCGSEDIRPVVRNVTSGKKEYTYREYHCQEPGCFARLALGASQDEINLYPKRRLDDKGRPTKPGDASGKYGKTRGWTKFKGDAEASDE